MKIKIPFIALLLLIQLSCNKEERTEIGRVPNSNYIAKNVLIVVIDGPRYVDTWAHANSDRIPNQLKLKQEGTFFSNFYNNGFTYTVPGHAAITTGVYENIHNGGEEHPGNGSIFQSYLSQTLQPPSKSCIITSKGKLATLGNSKKFEWRNSFLPSLYTVDREDSVTLRIAKEILLEDQPALALVQFKGPDVAGHADNWKEYLENIKRTDRYVMGLWEFIQANDFYSNKTALFITNDHGRHLDGVRKGFVSHGDRCEGCTHISLLALGPDFEKGKLIDKKYEQIDIAPTIATILNFAWSSDGSPIHELIQ